MLTKITTITITITYNEADDDDIHLNDPVFDPLEEPQADNSEPIDKWIDTSSPVIPLQSLTPQQHNSPEKKSSVVTTRVKNFRFILSHLCNFFVMVSIVSQQALLEIDIQ